MAETHVISALATKRGELLGSIRHYKQLIYSLDKDLATIDATIRIFDPNYSFKDTKITNIHRNRFFKIGEAKTLILTILKNQDNPMRTDDLSDIVASKKGLLFENDFEVRGFKKAVNNALVLLKNANLIEQTAKEGVINLWRIKELG
jgi:hypothetical protein